MSVLMSGVVEQGGAAEPAGPLHVPGHCGAC